MTSVQIPFIEFTNNRIQKSSIIIDNNQFNVEFKDGKYVVSKGNAMSETSSPAQQNDTGSAPAQQNNSKSAPAPAPEPKKIESIKTAAQTNDKSETQKSDTGPDPKPLKSGTNKPRKPIVKELTNKEKMMEELFKAIALRREEVQEEKVEKVQEEGKPTESKYKTYNTMKKIGQPEGAIRQNMSNNGIEEKEINNYFDSQEYKDIKPSN